MRRILARTALAAAVVVGLALAGHLLTRPHGPLEQKTPSSQMPTPTLYCEFYNFMRNATVVSFLFAVERASSGNLRFLEMAVVEPDGTRIEYDRSERLRWMSAVDDGTPTINSPDNATRIVLYGFKPNQPGIFWIEAGVRSDVYKNLEGKCRQSNFGTARG